jgi:hypothetical protein
MVNEIRTRRVLLAATCFVGIVCSGCEAELPPATARVPALAAPAPGQGSVVFVRPESQCDRSDYTILADDQGNFVGNVGPGTRIAQSVSPGTHIFYSWSSYDLRVEKEPNFNAAGAVRVTVAPSETRYVTVTMYRPHYECQEWPVVEMHAAHKPGELADVQSMVSSTKPVAVDRAAGQALLDAKPNLLQTNLDQGRWKLLKLDDQHAREERSKATQAEQDNSP